MARVSREVARQHETDAWKLRVEGYSQPQIAERLGISQPSVSRILARVTKRMTAQLVGDVAAFKTLQMARLERVHAEAVEAWSASKEAKKKSRKKTTTVPILKTGSETPAPAIAREEEMREAITSTGNPAYLQTAMAAIAEENKLLGLHAPKKIDLLDQRRPLEQLSDEELAARAKEADALLKAEGRG